MNPANEERVEIIEAILSINARAQRCQYITRKFSTDAPTEWDRRHADLDSLIDRALHAVGIECECDEGQKL